MELSGHALSKMDLRELARPRLTQLMDTTGLLCHLGIIDNGSAYYILKVESSATISVRSHEGKSLSLYRSGIGKCPLAWQPEAVQKSIIEELVWGADDTHHHYPSTTALRGTGAYSPSGAGAMTTAKIMPMSVVSLRRCLTPITSLPLRFRWSVPAYKSMKNTVIIWRARLLPAPGIFHVCWDGKVPLTYRPHNNGEHHDPTKNQTGSRLVYWRCDSRKGAGGGDYHDQGANHWIDDHIATPMSKYRDYEQSRQSFGINVLGTLIVEVEAENGQTGFAVSTAGEMGCFIVEKHLNRFIEGKCVSDIKLIHDQMLNATLYYSGSGGLVMNTISCVDLALWDLFGKVVGLPVYKLLGGAVRDEIQFYATGARPDLAKRWALSVAKCRRTGGHMMVMRGSAKMPLWSRICVKNAVRISG